MKNFGDALISCNSTDQLIWKDQICDGKQDCMNNEDEEGCSGCEFFCEFNFGQISISAYRYYDRVIGGVNVAKM